MNGRRGEYSERVRQAFFDPRRAGVPTGGGAIEAAAREGGAGMRIRLYGTVADGCWASLRYRAFGCPHLVAAAEEACARFEGAPVGSVREFPVDDLMATLQIPVEKTGRVLLLEDAFLALADTAEGAKSPK